MKTRKPIDRDEEMEPRKIPGQEEVMDPGCKTIKNAAKTIRPIDHHAKSGMATCTRVPAIEPKRWI